MRKIMNYSKVKVKKGDEVVIISGNHKGKKGAVKFVFPKIGAVVVEGVNIVKRAVKPQHNNNENFLKREKPILISKVRILKAGAKKVAKKSVKKS